MDQKTLLTYRQEDWKDYHRHYLVPFYKEVSAQRRTQFQEAYTKAFLEKHSVAGTLTREKALKIASKRSGAGTRDFESTIATEDLLASIVEEVASRFISGHGPAFQTYRLNASGQLIHVSVKEGKGAYVRQAHGSFKVGIDKDGLIDHLESTSYSDMPS